MVNASSACDTLRRISLRISPEETDLKSNPSHAHWICIFYEFQQLLYLLKLNFRHALPWLAYSFESCLLNCPGWFPKKGGLDLRSFARRICVKHISLLVFLLYLFAKTLYGTASSFPILAIASFRTRLCRFLPTKSNKNLIFERASRTFHQMFDFHTPFQFVSVLGWHKFYCRILSKFSTSNPAFRNESPMIFVARIGIAEIGRALRHILPVSHRPNPNNHSPLSLSAKIGPPRNLFFASLVDYMAEHNKSQRLFYAVQH